MLKTLFYPLKDNPVACFGVVFILLVLAQGTFLGVYNPAHFNQSLSVEDGFLEWLQFWAVVFACTVLVFRVWRLYGQKNCYFLIINALAALAFFMVAGEEISWGQRLLNIETSPYFLQHNAQQEMNLHNLVLEDGTKVNKILLNRIAPLFMLLYTLVLPFAYRHKAVVRALCARFGLPVPQFYQLFLVVLTVLMVEGIVKLTGDPSRKGELTEFALYGITLLMVAYPQNAQNFRA